MDKIFTYIFVQQKKSYSELPNPIVLSAWYHFTKVTVKEDKLYQMVCTLKGIGNGAKRKYGLCNT